jgi:hypothetical protein
MNFPPGLRHVMHVGMFLWALDKGTDGALSVIVEELLLLWHQGIAIEDIVYRVAIVSVVLDGKGLEKVKKQQGNGSYAGCTDCDMDGLRFNDAMCIYGHRRYVKTDWHKVAQKWHKVAQNGHIVAQK